MTIKIGLYKLKSLTEAISREPPWLIVTNQEQTETEITYQPFAEFLQNTPPNQVAHISDLAVSQNVGPYPSIEKKINAPELRLYCSHELCNGVRFFRCIDPPANRKSLDHHTISHLYVRYQCSNCKEILKIYGFGGEN